MASRITLAIHLRFELGHLARAAEPWRVDRPIHQSQEARRPDPLERKNEHDESPSSSVTAHELIGPLRDHRLTIRPYPWKSE